MEDDMDTRDMFRMEERLKRIEEKVDVIVKLVKYRSGYFLKTPISKLEGISLDVIKVLEDNHIETLGLIALKSKKELLGIKGFKKKYFFMVKEYLSCFGITIPYWE